MVGTEPVTVIVAADGCSLMGRMTKGVPPVTVADAAAGLRTVTEIRAG
jgi:hypothetical protein